MKIQQKLFNMRVTGTSLLVFLLLMANFIEIAGTRSFNLIAYKSTEFILIFIFGVLVISAIARETRQREQIEKLAKDVQDSYELEIRAYAVEKQARQELENLDRTKNQFLVLIQHNLRAPLTSMMGYSDMLLGGSLGRQTKKTTEVVQKFQTSTKSLIKMVNDFLDITQFQLGKDVLRLKEGILLKPILEEILAELKEKAETKGIYLKFEPLEKDITIKADREKLKAALTNIVDNSIKYTLVGGVTVNLKNHKNITIAVSDTGIGISKANLATVFTRIFERDDRAKKTTLLGSGIGLYLASQIIKYHQGRIWAESAGEGKGSTFYIELPIGSNEHLPANKDAGELEQGQPGIKNL